MSDSPAPAPVPVQLGGVAETLLWTLHLRASEAARPDAVLRDPEAVAVRRRLDYPFERRFGRSPLEARWQALRSLCFDEAVRSFLDARPDATVVALGEGLETQFWRVDNGRVRWLSVDLPEVVELQRALLPRSPRRRALACSVADGRWLDEAAGAQGVLVVAKGVLMYLEPREATRAIAACAAALPGGGLVFDAVPHWYGARTHERRLHGGDFRPPPMPWRLDADELPSLRDLHPNVEEVRELRVRGGPDRYSGRVAPALARLPWLRRRRLSIALVRFAQRNGTKAPPPARV